MHVSQWLTDAKTHGSSDMTVMLVGNKCDLEHVRQVSTEEGKKLHLKMDYFSLKHQRKHPRMLKQLRQIAY